VFTVHLDARTTRTAAHSLPQNPIVHPPLNTLVDSLVNQPRRRELSGLNISLPSRGVAMESSHLQPEQVERMLGVVLRQRDYLSRLIERMRLKRFPPDDPIFRATLGAYEKTSNLCVVIAKFRAGGSDDEGVMSRKPWGG
jgi:hypothetical protein